MKNIADIADDYGAWLRVDLIPGTTLDDPELIMVTVRDENLAAISLTRAQASALIDGLEDALWECQ